MKLKLLIFLCLLLFLIIPPSWGQEDATMENPADTLSIPPPAPVTNLRANDVDNDHGHAIEVRWTKSVDDGAGLNNVFGYVVYRALSPEGPFEERGRVPIGEEYYNDVGSKEKESIAYMPDYTNYFYKIRTLTSDSTIFRDTGVLGPVYSYGQWFNKARIPVLIFVAGFLIVTLFFISKAKSGADLFVRQLAGIEAVDEAIGRATEMGKPILYVLGLGTASEIATIASFTILGRVAKKVAEYQTGLIVPCYDPIVMTVAQETVKASYMDAGRPDSYNDDMVYFVTQSQFAYVAAVNGTMLRELPATNIYMGKFFAESLILAETGALAGSIQIAGTDEIAQIPFFVVACDYTLIGEELYAASAYLGREPILLGSLKAQDYAKAAVIFIAIIGFITVNFGWTGFTQLFEVPNSFFSQLFGGPS